MDSQDELTLSCKIELKSERIHLKTTKIDPLTIVTRPQPFMFTKCNGFNAYNAYTGWK